jgi:hypothetical protein
MTPPTNKTLLPDSESYSGLQSMFFVHLLLSVILVLRVLLMILSNVGVRT